MSSIQATAGLLADGRHLVNRIRDEAQQYRDFYKTQVPGKVSLLKCTLTACHTKGYFRIWLLCRLLLKELLNMFKPTLCTRVSAPSETVSFWPPLTKLDLDFTLLSHQEFTT
jgi:hypothetical protein